MNFILIRFVNDLYLAIMNKDKKSLAETHPEVAKQWHPTKNGDLTPYDVTKGMNKKVWWKCEKGGDHEWEMLVTSRGSQGQGCTICKGLKIVKSNCLATLNPDLSNEWHPILNNSLTPFDVIPGTSKKVWWKCDKSDDHEWEASVKNRNKGAGCPVCTGRKIVTSNCLKTLYPEISSQWHPTKNKELTPYQFAPGSHKKVWWKCDKGDDHEWETAIGNRAAKKTTGCPICAGLKVVKSNCIGTTHPELCKEWDYKKNKKITPQNIIAGSSKKVWWKCDKGDDHSWQAAPNNRTTNNSGCSICTNQIIVKSNCLNTVYPKLAKEWHPTKNKELTPYQFAPGSHKKVWWKCDKGDDHEWKTTIVSRTRINAGCPICSGRKLGKSNSLAFRYPDISKLWHTELNRKLTPNDIISNSHKKVWWKCEKGNDHEWRSSPNTFVQNQKNSSTNGCPVCRGLKVVLSNSLITISPDLSKQWHPTKNGKLTPNKVTNKSGKKVWWKCDKGDDHEWKISIANRSNGSSCPFCDLTPQSKQELTITFELMKLFKNIDPKGLKTKLEGKLRAIDIYIPKLNLCVEFDGSYWHKDKQDIDKIKSEMLFEEGFKLIRVREEPLKKIYDTDVISKKPYNGKQVTNDILSMILSIFELDAKLASNIKAYQSKEGLQNEKGLDRYIDKILTEKAEKNGSIRFKRKQ